MTVTDFTALYRDRLPAPTRSPLNVVFSGYRPGTRSGAWTMRGLQVATRRVNWLATNAATADQIAAADLVCFVKKPDPELVLAARAMGKPVVLDVVDSWGQPRNNRAVADAAGAKAFYKEKWTALPPFDGHIFATRRMYEDLGGLSRNATWIYHHANPLLGVTPQRERVSTVGYQGDERFLGRWRGLVEAACKARGLRFVVNPADYGVIDIGFAVRDADFAGYFPNKYKSNVKMANFMATGTPCIVGLSEIAYHETGDGGIRFLDESALDASRLGQALDELLPLAARQAARAHLLATAPKFGLEAVATQFERYFLAVHARRQAENPRTAAA